MLCLKVVFLKFIIFSAPQALRELLRPLALSPLLGTGKDCTWGVPLPTKFTVSAKTITEFILERAGPVILMTFLLQLKAFRLVPATCPARGTRSANYWKRWLIPGRAYLRGPAAIFLISRDPCSDSIAKLFCACFNGGTALIAPYVAKMGYRTDVPVKLSARGGYRTILGECYPPLERIARCGVSQR